METFIKRPSGQTIKQSSTAGLLILYYYGIALMVECFGAALFGASMTKAASAWCPTSEDKGDLGQMFLAIDISKFESVREYSKRVEKMIDELKASKLAERTDRIYYPGEREILSRARCIGEGEVDVADSTLCMNCA